MQILDLRILRPLDKKTILKALKKTKKILFVDNGMKLQDSSADYVMAFNLLHIESPVALLQETYRILKVGGKLGIIHWNYDPSTPRGPSIAIRPKPEQCINWATQAGFNQLAQTDLKPYHYGLLFQK